MDKLPGKTFLEPGNGVAPQNDSFQQEKSDFLEGLREGYAPYFNQINQMLLADKEVILELAKFDGWATLQEIAVNFRSDKDVVLACARQNINALEFASPEILRDKDFVLELMKIDGMAIGYLGKEFSEDEEIASAAVSNNPQSIIYLEGRLREKYREEELLKRGLISKRS